MVRYLPVEYLTAMGEAVDDNGLRRIGWISGDTATELSMTSFLGFLDEDGRAGSEGRELS